MKNDLQSHFPMIRSRQELIDEIHASPRLRQEFHSWPEKRRQEFLDICTGVRGIKLLYDPFFKEIMNPETTPERLERLLSLLLDTEVKILHVLPGDSTRLADEASLLITDIVVELKSHEIANVEIQKIGYLFPGQRSACYSADLLLRQYKRTRSQQKKHFSYRQIRTVYTIVLFEKSPREFHASPGKYLHYFSQQSNTGVELELLQKYIFIPLDIFRKILQNRGITSELDAWLTLFCTDEPEEILKLIQAYPEFIPIYEQLYNLCQNIEGVMKMFSKELQILDRNTVRLMIDQMQRTVNRQAKKIARQKKKIAEQEEEYARQKEENARQEQEHARREQEHAREYERQRAEDRRHYEEQLAALTERLAQLEQRQA